jgi:glycosyltransferase involved in cell wall biosynthesis
MRIAFFTELFWPSRGGQEFRYGRLAAVLSSAGHTCEVFTVDYTGGSLPAEERVDGIRVVRYLRLPRYLKPGSRSLMGLGRYAVRTAREIRARQGEYDAVVVNEMPLSHLPLVDRDPRLVVDWCEYTPGNLAGSVEWWASRRFGRNLAVDETVLRRFRAPNGHGRWCVVHTPLDLSRYAQGPKVPGRILFIGRLVPHKNVRALARAVVQLNAARPPVPWELVVVGDGPLAPALREEFAADPFVRFVGPVDDTAKYALLASAYLLALPSRREGLPNTALEAVASGTPIVTADARGNALREFVREHGVGVVAAGSNPAALAAACAGIDPETWNRCVTCASALEVKLDMRHSAQVLTTFLAGAEA